MKRLDRTLRLVDVYAISTGAMFSSGFFLLPGIAAAKTGTSVILAYLFAGILILPAMFSIAELATALPRAGGAYYFLDRAMGPMVGTIGGLGSWLALVLKSAFALIGMGAYLALYWEVPVKPLAVALTLVFMAFNIFGAKESSGLQRWLVYILVGVLGFFVAEGLFELFMGTASIAAVTSQEFSIGGIDAFFATVGLVFVSYAGLTKVASVAEEVQNPDRNIPLGMFLSLATATTIYVVGVFIMTAVLEPSEFHSDITPVATAAGVFLDAIPWGVGLVVVAAIAAFASTGNAGIMAASRYPLAMARDRLVPERFGVVGRFGTPTTSILVTGGLMIFLIVALDIESVAKLASAFQLLLFGLTCLAVVVMREAQIDYYRPGFKSPLYPWMQIAGMLIPIWLIVEMGWTAILFVAVVLIGCLAWYFGYARKRVERDGAVFHVFERLGRRVYRGLDHELRTIVAEKGLADDDPFEEVVMRARVLDIEGETTFERVLDAALEMLSERADLDRDQSRETILEEAELGMSPVASGAIVPHLRLAGIEHPELVMVRVQRGFEMEGTTQPVSALILLASPLERAGQHFRMLARIAGRIDDEDFLTEWLIDATEADFKETLIRDERFMHIRLDAEGKTAHMIGGPIREAGLPNGVLVALIRRGGETIVPSGNTVLADGDWLTIIGDVGTVHEVHESYFEAGKGPTPVKRVG